MSETGRTLYTRMGVPGTGWQPEDAFRCPRPWIVMTARFLTGHCHLGAFSLPRGSEEEEEEEIPCPLCEAVFSAEHLIWECPALAEERRDILGGARQRHEDDLQRLIFSSCATLGRFLWTIRGHFPQEEAS